MALREKVALLLCRGLLRLLRNMPDGPEGFWIRSHFCPDPSQFGEARILQLAKSIADNQGTPVPSTFLELGANHPYQLSNSWYLERDCGFTGVSVDPLCVYQDLFRRTRSKTRFLRAAVVPRTSTERQVRVFHCESDVFSTLDRSEEAKLQSMDMKGVEVVAPTVHYDDLVNSTEFSQGLGILFLDIESHDLQLAILSDVITSSRKPSLICVETLEFAGRQRDFRDAYRKLLEPAGYYELASSLLNTVFHLQP